MKKLLVIVDYQNDLVSGEMGCEKARELEEPLYKKIKEHLDSGEPVAFTLDTHYKDYLETREGKELPIIHCINGTEGHKLYGKIQEFKDLDLKGTYFFTKDSFGISPEDLVAFSSHIMTELETIEVVGIITNMRVLSNAILFQSQYTNARIIVDASLCASSRPKHYVKSFDILEELKIEVLNRQTDRIQKVKI